MALEAGHDADTAADSRGRFAGPVPETLPLRARIFYETDGCPLRGRPGPPVVADPENPRPQQAARQGLSRFLPQNRFLVGRETNFTLSLRLRIIVLTKYFY